MATRTMARRNQQSGRRLQQVSNTPAQVKYNRSTSQMPSSFWGRPHAHRSGCSCPHFRKRRLKSACRSISGNVCADSVQDMASTTAPRKAQVGRPSKGPRDAILARPHASLGMQIRQLAATARLTNGEYMVKLAAEELDVPEFLPCPSVRNVNALEAEPVLKHGRDAIMCKPPVAFGRIIKRQAKAANLTYGDYMVMLAAQALGMTEHAPQASDQLDFPKEARLTAA